MGWKAEYDRWLNHEALNKEMSEELEQAKQNESLLEDCFHKNLEFGTAGMRGELGAGTNRLNVYTIRKAAEGLARFIEKQGDDAKQRGVVIAYDSRHKSSEFAMEAALTIGAHGIKVYVFEELRPTPELSFAVRYLHTFSGIVITASHNPPEYNGFKVYGKDGGQLPPEQADELINYVNGVDNELTIETAKKEAIQENGMLQMISEEVDAAYMNHLQSIIIQPNLVYEVGKDLKIVFSPLHGAANFPVQRSLEAAGFQQVTVVQEQEQPDPNFTTVKSPNPEDVAAFELAMSYGEAIHADLLIATDPDGDRVGVSVRNHDGEFIVLTGNQTGALLIEYLLSQKQMKGVLPQNGVILKSIVTSELGRQIADAYGVTTIDVLTGFKFIAEKMRQFEETKEFSFQMGYEESYGYLIRDFARDKDAVQAVLLISEVAAYYKEQGKTLYDGLLNIYEKYGYYREGQVSLSFKGIEGTKKIESIMNSFRQDIPSSIAETTIIKMADYNEGVYIDLMNQHKEETLLPKSNVLKFFLEDGSWFCIRPSGTEPKIKFYFDVNGLSMEDSERKFNKMKDFIMQRVG
ncbi:phospho-sugar mutase [Bacillus sp. JJ722]|uniref:phospho-sugar mutase n=1 Tax=Bacillus sp. JJ722 TaxID=3122973 RepID=UPI0030007014